MGHEPSWPASAYLGARLCRIRTLWTLPCRSGKQRSSTCAAHLTVSSALSGDGMGYFGKTCKESRPAQCRALLCPKLASCARTRPRLRPQSDTYLGKELNALERSELYAEAKNRLFFGVGDALAFLLASMTEDRFSPVLDGSTFARIAFEASCSATIKLRMQRQSG